MKTTWIHKNIKLNNMKKKVNLQLRMQLIYNWKNAKILASELVFVWRRILLLFDSFFYLTPEIYTQLLPSVMVFFH